MRLPALISLVILAMLLPLALSSCGETSGRQPTTRIDPQTVQQSSSLKDKGAGSVRIRVTPAPTVIALTTPPASTAATTTTTYAGPAITRATAATQPSSVMVDGTTITAAAGSAIVYERSDAAETDTYQQGSAAGATLRTNGEMKGDWNSTPPALQFGAISTAGPNGHSTEAASTSTAGGSEFTWLNEVLSAVTTPGSVKFMGWAGVIIMFLGILMIVIEHMIGGTADWALFGLIEAAGLGLLMLSIVITAHPWLFLLFFAAVIGGIAWYVLYWKKKSAAAPVAGTAAAAAVATSSSLFTDVEKMVDQAMAKLKPSPAPAASAPAVPAAGTAAP